MDSRAGLNAAVKKKISQLVPGLEPPIIKPSTIPLSYLGSGGICLDKLREITQTYSEDSRYLNPGAPHIHRKELYLCQS
jgi:hypothetical protein